MDYKTDNIRYIETYAKARAKYESRLGILNAFSGIYLQLKYNTPETFDKYSEEYKAIMENSKAQYNALVADMCRLSDRYKQIISEESNEELMRICSGIDTLIAEVNKELELLALVGKSLLKKLNENKKAIKESKADLWTEKNIRDAKEAKRALKDTVDEKRNLKKCYVEIKKEIREAIKATNTKTRK